MKYKKGAATNKEVNPCTASKQQSNRRGSGGDVSVGLIDVWARKKKQRRSGSLIISQINSGKRGTKIATNAHHIRPKKRSVKAEASSARLSHTVNKRHPEIATTATVKTATINTSFHLLEVCVCHLSHPGEAPKHGKDQRECCHVRSDLVVHAGATAGVDVPARHAIYVGVTVVAVVTAAVAAIT
jgi:hypothetical protein